MLCVAIHMLAGTSYLDGSSKFGISVPSLNAILEEVHISLDHALKNKSFQKSEANCHRESVRFSEKRRSPISGMLAALDGVAIDIEKQFCNDVSGPKKYRNRETFFAIVVQKAVTADYKFIFVSATHDGGTHESTAFKASSLNSLIVGCQLPAWTGIVSHDAYRNNLNVIITYS